MGLLSEIGLDLVSPIVNTFVHWTVLYTIHKRHVKESIKIVEVLLPY